MNAVILSVETVNFLQPRGLRKSHRINESFQIILTDFVQGQVAHRVYLRQHSSVPLLLQNLPKSCWPLSYLAAELSRVSNPSATLPFDEETQSLTITPITNDGTSLMPRQQEIHRAMTQGVRHEVVQSYKALLKIGKDDWQYGKVVKDSPPSFFCTTKAQGRANICGRVGLTRTL